jgi:hypothetical protein
MLLQPLHNANVLQREFVYLAVQLFELCFLFVNRCPGLMQIMMSDTKRNR